VHRFLRIPKRLEITRAHQEMRYLNVTQMQYVTLHLY